jgi:hypothetical protein
MLINTIRPLSKVTSALNQSLGRLGSERCEIAPVELNHPRGVDHPSIS